MSKHSENPRGSGWDGFNFGFSGFDAQDFPPLENLMKRFGGMLKKFTKMMPYDIQEHENKVIITVPLPGYGKDDVNISVRGKELLIQADRDDIPQMDIDTPEFQRKMGNRFFWARPIDMRIPVGSEIPPETVKAKIEKGLLEVSFEKTQSKNVKIEVEEESE